MLFARNKRKRRTDPEGECAAVQLCGTFDYACVTAALGSGAG